MSQNLPIVSGPFGIFCLYVIVTISILGDPGAVSRVGRKGRTKVFKYGRKSPWVPTLTELFPKIQADAGSWLGTKNALYYCAQSANSLSWVLFASSYTTTIIVSITACMDHAPKKCTQSGNFQFDIKSPPDFKILSAWKLKTLFQKYKLEVTKVIHIIRQVYEEITQGLTCMPSYVTPTRRVSVPTLDRQNTRILIIISSCCHNHSCNVKSSAFK